MVFSVVLTPFLVIEKVNAQEEDSWTTLEPMQEARGHLGVAVVNDKIYAIGGDRVSLTGNCIGPSFGNVLNATEEYDSKTDQWTFKTPMPTPRANFGIVVYQNKIYCIGGYIGNSQCTGTVEVYDPTTDTWETKTSMPTPRMDLQANVVEGKIYLIGGKTSGSSYLNTNEVYDPSTDTWTTKTPAPNRITSGASASSNNKIYFLATVSSLDLGAFIQIYDPINNSWTIGAKSPTYGGWSTTATVSANNISQQILFFSESSTCVYFPANNSWAIGTKMPSSRGFTGVTALNDDFYVLGGIPAPFQGYIVITASTNKNERYTPDEYETINPDTKIYIKSDGSIESTTANISTSDNFVYIFTGNNSGRIIIERDNIVLNGNGYFLEGTSSFGIALFQRHNVTIANLTISGFQTAGIGIESSTHNLISGNNILSSTNEGIRLYSGASNNTITENNIKFNQYMAGIHFFSGATNNLVSSNTITNNCYGILSWSSTNNTIKENIIQSNSQYDIYLVGSSNNTITGNNLGNTEWHYAIYLNEGSNSNLIFSNELKNSEIGIVIEESTNNQIFRNNFIENQEANAKDDSINIWDNGIEGNFWDDYSGIDANGDGIGDTPYIINENNQDNYPGVEPTIIPEFPSWTILPFILTITLFSIIVKRKLQKG